MAVAAVSIIGPGEISQKTYREAVAAMAARLNVVKVGPIVSGETFSTQAVILRTSIGPALFEKVLQTLGKREGVTYCLLAYGALVYRSVEFTVPPKGIYDLREALESLAAADPGFEIPNMGNVCAHLLRVSERQQI